MGYSYKGSRSPSVARKYSRSGTGQRRTSSPNRHRGAGQYIDPARFVKVATAAEVEAYVPMYWPAPRCRLGELVRRWPVPLREYLRATEGLRLPL
jgi:hypothetical protein